MPTPVHSLEPVPIRVALIEDDPHQRDAFVDAIAATSDMHLAGVAATRAAGLTLLANETMDVLLVDLGLPDGSGIDIIRAAQICQPHCAVMVASMFGDEGNVMRSIEAGAAGYLLKDSAAGTIIEEIRSLHAGGSPISPRIARQVLLHFRQRGLGPSQPAQGMPAALSARERQVLELVTKGFSGIEIGQILGVAPNTVRTFVRRIYAKLEVSTKAAAVEEARRLGLV